MTRPYYRFDKDFLSTIVFILGFDGVLATIHVFLRGYDYFSHTLPSMLGSILVFIWLAVYDRLSVVITPI